MMVAWFSWGETSLVVWDNAQEAVGGHSYTIKRSHYNNHVMAIKDHKTDVNIPSVS